jgi:hypothetical protein
MSAQVPPRAPITQVMKVLFACQEKNLSWGATKKDLRTTLLQRETCKFVNNVAIGIENPPVSLDYSPPKNPGIFMRGSEEEAIDVDVFFPVKKIARRA